MTRKFKCPYCGRESAPERIGELWLVSCSYYTCSNPYQFAGDNLDDVIEAFEIHTPEYGTAEGQRNEMDNDRQEGQPDIGDAGVRS